MESACLCIYDILLAANLEPNFWVVQMTGVGVGVERLEGSADNPGLNIVFIHGLGDSAHGAWSYEQKTYGRSWLSRINWFRQTNTSEVVAKSLFWPEWLVEDEPSYAIYLIDYPAGKMGWNVGWPLEEAAVAVLDRLIKNPVLRKSDAPIVFICHSLGGIVIKQLILKANSGRDLNAQKGAFLDRVAGVVFLATPHDGSILATLASKFGWLVTETMRDLIANSAKLGDLADNYRDYVAANEGRIRHLIYYEKERIGGVVTVVASGSANPGLAGAERIPIGRDHIGICKLDKRTDQVYEGVLAFLEEALKPRPPTQDEKLGAVKDDTQAIRENVEDLRAGLPLNVAEQVVALLGKRELENATRAGLERATILELARPLRSYEITDLNQAVAELRNAVGIALDVIAKGERPSNEEDFVKDVLKRLAETTKSGDFESGSKEVDNALAELDRRDEEQRQASRRSREALLEAGVEQDLLRRNASAVARRIEAIAALDAADGNPAWSAKYRERWDALYEQGDKQGINLSLEVAIEMARRMVARARNGEQRGTSLVLLGAALVTLGARESGTARLEEAVAAYREAVKEYTQERAPLQWAATQNNLGNALVELGERESGTARLEEAVSAYREALKEYTQERVPLDWAMTQNNLGTALVRLAERESGAARLEEAVRAYREALKEWTRERVPLNWAKAQNNLGIALAELGARESSAARLEEAVAAYREALKESTRERVPLRWAGTQNNLGTALTRLGMRQSSAARLEEAVLAYREALKEWTRERVPLDWAGTQMNLAWTYRAFFDKDQNSRHLDDALKAADGALEEFGKASASFYIEKAERQRKEILALKEKPLPDSRHVSAP